ncbi:hypothetical protein LNQ52_04045 [Klebsiella pneumoniae subsp. pneumoniae]|nr:hypothetical protein [Klebsiella pneumoniae subsp. pneumoniae]
MSDTESEPGLGTVVALDARMVTLSFSPPSAKTVCTLATIPPDHPRNV